ncbi:MAG: AgmX/PglI C-terminal domain-containing protein [Gammaproteobacteria bacterium]|nr:AgmX/PglI C-terminal domain-containing protein [Gammaproteobacteria bacterium]
MNKNISYGIFLTFAGVISTPCYAETSNNDTPPYDINSKTASNIVSPRQSKPTTTEILAAARARANMSANGNMKAHLCLNYHSGSAKWTGAPIGANNSPQVTLALDPKVVPIYGYFDQSEELGAERDDLGNTVSHLQDQIYTAYKHALVNRPKLSGQITYDIGITTDGRVFPASLGSSQLNDSQFESKLLNLINTMRFAAGCFTPWQGKFTLNFYPESLTATK